MKDKPESTFVGAVLFLLVMAIPGSAVLGLAVRIFLWCAGLELP